MWMAVMALRTTVGLNPAPSHTMAAPVMLFVYLRTSSFVYLRLSHQWCGRDQLHKRHQDASNHTGEQSRPDDLSKRRVPRQWHGNAIVCRVSCAALCMMPGPKPTPKIISAPRRNATIAGKPRPLVAAFRSDSVLPAGLDGAVTLLSMDEVDMKSPCASDVVD